MWNRTGTNAMSLPTRHMLFGMAMGALSASALAAIGPGYVMEAFGDEMPAGFDTAGLVKIDDRSYRMDYEPWVATDPLSTATVKKIEAGRVTYVSIATTATGTYSSDGLTSRHVRYPGIEVEEVGHATASFFSWSGDDWSYLPAFRGNSYVSITATKAKDIACFAGASFLVC